MIEIKALGKGRNVKFTNSGIFPGWVTMSVSCDYCGAGAIEELPVSGNLSTTIECADCRRPLIEVKVSDDD